MGAKRRIKNLVGSLRKPHMRYVVNAHITLTPHLAKPHVRHFYDRFIELCAVNQIKPIQEEFKWSGEICTDRANPIGNNLRIEFVTGEKYEGDYSGFFWPGFIKWIYWQNEMSEAVRNEQGFDDEPPDEMED